MSESGSKASDTAAATCSSDDISPLLPRSASSADSMRTGVPPTPNMTTPRVVAGAVGIKVNAGHGTGHSEVAVATADLLEAPAPTIAAAGQAHLGNHLTWLH